MAIMTSAPRLSPRQAAALPGPRNTAMIAYLRDIVLAPPVRHERGHAVFLDADRGWIGDAPCGIGTLTALTLRMRALLGEALRHNAAGSSSPIATHPAIAARAAAISPQRAALPRWQRRSTLLWSIISFSPRMRCIRCGREV